LSVKLPVRALRILDKFQDLLESLLSGLQVLPAGVMLVEKAVFVFAIFDPDSFAPARHLQLSTDELDVSCFNVSSEVLAGLDVRKAIDCLAEQGEQRDTSEDCTNDPFCHGL
jgi:hypothetical protein